MYHDSFTFKDLLLPFSICTCDFRSFTMVTFVSDSKLENASPGYRWSNGEWFSSCCRVVLFVSHETASICALVRPGEHLLLLARFYS